MSPKLISLLSVSLFAVEIVSAEEPAFEPLPPAPSLKSFMSPASTQTPAASVASESLSPALSAEEAISPERSIEVADRLLANEVDTPRRVQLLLRWLKLKDQIIHKSLADLKGAQPTQELSDKIQNIKIEMVDRMMKEAEKLESASTSGALDPLYRQLAFRSMEVSRSDKAYYYFNRIVARSPEDELAFGDALLSSRLSNLALQAYDRALVKEELKPLALYKKAWAQIQLNQFGEAISTFEQVLEFKGEERRRLRETAFRDWQTPYIETFQKADFDAAEADRIFSLSLKVEDLASIPSSRGEVQTYQNAIKDLVNRFSQRGDIKKAEQAFKLLAEGKFADAVLLESAPFWLKSYRASLDHGHIESLLRLIPANAQLDSTQQERMNAELTNTAQFYETMVRDGKDVEKRPLLGLLYQVYFQFFQNQGASDAVRVNYAHYQLEEKNFDRCLDLISKRDSKDDSIKEKAETVEAQCRLKKLDLLYTSIPSDEFATALEYALLDQKLFTRKGLDVPEEQVYEHLARMLIGAVKKEPQSKLWADRLARVIKDYPYKTEGALYGDLTKLAAQIRFELLVADSQNSAVESQSADLNAKSQRAAEFFEIFKASDIKTELSEKSLRNSIELSDGAESFERCHEYRKSFASQFKPGQTIFDRCVRQAEMTLNLEQEESYWKSALKNLNRDQKIKLGLLELALAKPEGRNRIHALKDKKAQDALKAWDELKEVMPVPERPTPLSKSFQALKEKHDSVLAQLKAPVQIASDRIVVAKVKDVENLDKEWVKFSKMKPSAKELAHVYMYRAQLAKKLYEWYAGLPAPRLPEDELKTYEKKSRQVAEAWKVRADKLQNECSEVAYSLTVEFRPKLTAVCPENTRASIREAYINQWHQTRRGSEIKNPTVFSKFLKAAEEAKTTGQKKYFLLRANELAQNEMDQSFVELALARFTRDGAHYKNAAALNGDLEEPIVYLKAAAKGNPFYEQLYDSELKMIRDHAEPEVSATPITQASDEKNQ